MKKFTWSALGVAIVNSAAVCASHAALADGFTFTNNSPYYLYEVNKDAGCPGGNYSAPIKPGDTVTSTASWCGFDACTTGGNDEGPGFNSSGCLEAAKNGAAPSTQGGYATWFSLSQWSGCAGIAASNPYTCRLSGTSFNLDFTPITQVYSAGTDSGKPVSVVDAKAFSGMPYRGINISGLEYDGTFGDALYQKPDVPEVQYFLDQGMNTVRLPIRWEFVLSDDANHLAESHDPSNVQVNTQYMDAVRDTLSKLLKGSGNAGKGMKVIVDLHNYMRFCNTGAEEGQSNEPTTVSKACRIVTAAEMAYIWKTLTIQLEDLLKAYPDQLAFGLMNEPNSDSVNPITTQQVFDNEVAAYQAIRGYQASNSLAKNLIIFSGNGWDPMHDWTSGNGKVFTKEAFAKAGIEVDTDNVALEMHQYFDSNYSGLSSTCNTYTDINDFATKLNITDLPQWLKDNHLRAMVTEFGGSASDPTCATDMNYLLDFMTSNAYTADNKGGFYGWTAWRVNRHGPASDFNYLQQSNYNVYGALGTQASSPAGTGITMGAANALMQRVFAPHLVD